MILAQHISPLFTVPIAALLLVWIGWYWRLLGRDDVPETRRRIRRASMILMVFAVLAFLPALSFIDEDRDPSQYTITWAVAITLLLLIIFLASLDVLNNLRIHRRHAQEAAAETRARLNAAAEEARRRLTENLPGSRTPSQTPGDDHR